MGELWRLIQEKENSHLGFLRNGMLCNFLASSHK